MTIQSQIPVQSQVFIARVYEVFAGLDVDKHSIAGSRGPHPRECDDH